MARSARLVLFGALLTLLVPSLSLACLWDYDTIKMERTRFPSTLELVTGKFLRHSPEFYRWRIQDRLKRLDSDPSNVALLDDLAVAYDKTGQHDRAIETAVKTEKLIPGRYETAANLGTFYIHAGKLEEGIVHIDRALKINPDAHFGRERYQKLLVEYVIHRRKGGELKLPLAALEFTRNEENGKASTPRVSATDTFANFLSPDGKRPRLGSGQGGEQAIKGVLGMMKFGKHDSPVLLEALGSLLSGGEDDPKHDAKLLAARAYLKASYEVPDGAQRVAYRGMAATAIQMQSTTRENQVSLEQVEADFQKELKEARDWYAELSQRERSWIDGKQVPEAEFDKLYETEPEVSGLDVKDPLSLEERQLVRMLIGGGSLVALGLLAFVVGLIVFVRWRSKRNQATLLAIQEAAGAHRPHPALSEVDSLAISPRLDPVAERFRPPPAPLE